MCGGAPEDAAMNEQATTEKHWMSYWWPAFLIGGFAVLVLFAVGTSGQYERAMHDAMAAEERQRDLMPCAQLERADAKWAGFRAKESLAFSVALAAIDPFCLENQAQIANATIKAQAQLGAAGFHASAFEMMDAIYRQTADRRVGWSYTALVDEYAQRYVVSGAAAAERALPRLLRYPVAAER